MHASTVQSHDRSPFLRRALLGKPSRGRHTGLRQAPSKEVRARSVISDGGPHMVAAAATAGFGLASPSCVSRHERIRAYWRLSSKGQTPRRLIERTWKSRPAVAAGRCCGEASPTTRVVADEPSRLALSAALHSFWGVNARNRPPPPRSFGEAKARRTLRSAWVSKASGRQWRRPRVEQEAGGSRQQLRRRTPLLLLLPSIPSAASSSTSEGRSARYVPDLSTDTAHLHHMSDASCTQASFLASPSPPAAAPWPSSSGPTTTARAACASSRYVWRAGLSG